MQQAFFQFICSLVKRIGDGNSIINISFFTNKKNSLIFCILTSNYVFIILELSESFNFIEFLCKFLVEVENLPYNLE